MCFVYFLNVMGKILLTELVKFIKSGYHFNFSSILQLFQVTYLDVLKLKLNGLFVPDKLLKF